MAKKLIGAVAAFGLLAGAASAASNNATVSSGLQPYLGSIPVVGYISATLTSTTQPVLVAMPSTSKTLLTRVCSLRDSNGAPKAATITVSGSDLVVSTSVLASGTIAVGDVLQCDLQYQR